MIDHPLTTELRSALRHAAQAAHLLVASDFDGTLSPIVEDPSAAAAAPAALAALHVLTDLRETSVAVVSGRSLGDLVERCHLPASVHLVGSHGAEVGGDAVAGLDPVQAELRATVLDAVHGIAADVAGVLLEPKPGGVAVHVRQASRPDATRVLDAVRRGPASLPGVHALPGKEVLELSVRDASKGEAIDTLRRRTGAGSVVFLGDDVTDETVFTRLTTVDVGIKVGEGTTAARHRVRSVDDVAVLLAHLAAERARWLHAL